MSYNRSFTVYRMIHVYIVASVYVGAGITVHIQSDLTYPRTSVLDEICRYSEGTG